MREFVTDESDMATEIEMRDTALAIEHARKGRTLPHVGRCYNCEEEVPEPLRWCDGECRDDWSKRNGR